jgi:exodeoxyribonuclease-3
MDDMIVDGAGALSCAAVLIVTWNVNSLRARMPRVLEMLAYHAPDVVCLQETKCAPDTFPADELAQAGYSSMHHSGGQWAGVAILARRPLTLDEPLPGLPGEAARHEARWCEATVSGIRIASTYVPNGRALDSPEFPRKLTFLEAIAARAATQSVDTPLVIAGDLNIAPSDEDVYDPAAFIGSTHVSDEERERLHAILERGQMIDAYRYLYPDVPQFTWWDYRAGSFHKGLGMRIDLVLMSQALGSRLEQCWIDRDLRKGLKPSDHAPLLLQMRDSPTL